MQPGSQLGGNVFKGEHLCNMGGELQGGVIVAAGLSVDWGVPQQGETVLDVQIDRYQRLQASPAACECYANCLDRLVEARHWLTRKIQMDMVK